MDNQLQKGAEKLEEAIRCYELSAFETYPSLEGEISYSAAYQRKIRSLSRKKIRYTRHFNKRIAAALLAGVMLLGGITAVSANKRTEVTGWFTKVYDHFTEIFFEKRDISVAPKYLETVYLPPEMPDGYQLSEVAVQNYNAKTVWTNENGQKIILIQNMIDSKITLDHEDSMMETLCLNGQKIVIVKKKEKKCYYWNTRDYSFSLFVPDTMEDSQCLSMIFSLKKAEE